MNVSEFIKFLESQGHRVLKTKSCWWYDYYHVLGGSFYMSVPFHRPVMPDKREIATVFASDSRALGVRFPTHGRRGVESYMLVCSNRDYGFHSLHAKARNQTRRGMERCRVCQLDLRHLAEKASQIDKDSLRRGGREKSAMSPESWKAFCSAAERQPDFEAWGAYVHDDLAAFLVGVVIEDCFIILIERSKTEHLSSYPNNALIYVATEEILSRQTVSQISFGLKSLSSEMSSLDHFKLRMGYEARSFRECMVLHPLLSCLTCPSVHSLAMAFAKLAGLSDDQLCKLQRILEIAEKGKQED